jgi:hypothetical protein
MGDADLRRLFARAALFNEPVDVTGLLLFNQGVFVQTIEGLSDNVEVVLERIKSNRSHRIDSVFVDEAIDRRVYPAWAMMGSLFPADATLVSFLRARSEAPNAAFTQGQLDAIARTINFATGGNIDSHA